MAQGNERKTRVLESLYGEVALGAQGLLAAAAGPDVQTFVGGLTRVRTVNPDTEDGVEFGMILPRTIETDVNTITLVPTVRWTAISTTTADNTVTWKCDYTYANPALTPNVAAGTTTKFVDVRTLTPSVSTLTGHEYRQHLVTAFPAFHFPTANCAPSMLVMGNVRISSVSTCGNSLIGILGVGLSYLSGPSGTSSITP
jgi:hypothetical protein